MSKGLLYDATLCIGCKACEQACAQQNKLPYDDAAAAEQAQSDHKYTVVLAKGDKYMRRLCMNCMDPACASVCPVGALHKTAAGPVVYEESRCMGCRYCMVACPFGVPKYEWHKLLPRVQKCTMCNDRVVAGLPTACAEACPTGATKFGDRDELIAEARQRLRDNPGKYVDHIYGEKEAGGTSWLYLSGINFDQAGFDTTVGNEPIISNVKEFLGVVPMVLAIWPALFTGFHLLATRNGNDADDKNGQSGRKAGKP
jgi:formate dehydrogenase iron-sulfur subunit